MSWKMFLDERLWDGCSRLFIRKEASGAPGSEAAFVTCLTLESFAPTMEAAPAIKGSMIGRDDAKAFLQAALDCAWDAGMRPAGWADHGREVAALRDHLHDMRALVYAGDMKPEEKMPPALPSQGRK
jgi:hypothetical protein